MKLIIEIDDKNYKAIVEQVKKNDYPDMSTGRAIANGTPYTPKGDLISRSEAKKLGATCLARRNENGQLETIISLDNAPTIEFPPVINMKPLTAEEKQGLIDALKKSRLKVVKLDDVGIRGEWARHDEWVNGEYVGGFYHVNCPVIEEGYALYSRWETRFCPNCGAPMLKGGDNA